MLFIGTMRGQQEIAYNKERPDFYLENISGDELPIRHAFTNEHIYFVGTSRGCSCDFGIGSNEVNPATIGQVVPIQKLFNLVRKMNGTYQQWKDRHAEKVEREVNEIKGYREQTLRLLAMIESETRLGNKVEMYCTYAGEYDAEPLSHEIVNTRNEDIKLDFEVHERVFREYV